MRGGGYDLVAAYSSPYLSSLAYDPLDEDRNAIPWFVSIIMTMYRIGFVWLLVSLFHSPPKSLASQDAMAGPSFLKNWKCAVKVNGCCKLFVDKGESRLSADGELIIGCHLAKPKCTQTGIIRSTRERITLNAGRGLVTLESGIRYPYQERFSSLKGFRLQETFVVFPLRIVFARPDFFAKGTYVTYFIGCNTKCLTKSQYLAGENAHTLPEAYHQDIVDLREKFPGLKRWLNSLELGGGLLFSNGLFVETHLDIPLHSLRASQVDALKPEQCKFDELYIHSARTYYFTHLVSFGIGLDLCMLLKSRQEKA